jgi:DNA modification methylase
LINEILTGDNIDLLRTFYDESIDLTVTSPPYDSLRTYNGFSFDFENIAKELYRVTKSGGVVVWVVGDSIINGSESLTSFRQALYFKEIGFNIHDTMIYTKPAARFPEKTRYYQVFEYMFILSKGKPATINLLQDRKNKQAGEKARSNVRRKDGSLLKERPGAEKGRTIKEFGVRFNVWQYPTGYMRTTKDKIAFEHPAIFPEGLAEDHILSWSKPGDIVLDPFGGSGTTAKMAKKNGRNFIHIDISNEYNLIARERINGVK